MATKNEEIIQEIINKNFESNFANSLNQISSFIDQLLIEMSSEKLGKESHVKSLVSLKSFIENSMFEYKIKSFLLSKVESKKKEKQKEKESQNQKDQSEQDLLK